MKIKLPRAQIGDIVLIYSKDGKHSRYEQRRVKDVCYWEDSCGWMYYLKDDRLVHITAKNQDIKVNLTQQKSFVKYLNWYN